MNIEGISFESADGTKLENVSGYLEATDKMITLNDFQLTMGGISVDWDAKINYNRFSDIIAMSPTVGLEIDLVKTDIKLGDLEPFLPFLWTDSILAPQARQAHLNLIVHADGTLGDLELTQLTLETNSLTSIDLSGWVKGLPDYKTAELGVEIKEITTNYYDILALMGDIGIPSAVGKFGTINLKGSIAGRMDSLDMRNLQLTTTGTTGLAGNIKAVGLPDIDNTRFAINLDYLRTNVKEVAPFAGDSLPAPVMKLGTVTYSGTFEGSITDMELNGLLTTDIGSLTADLAAKFNKDYTDATYDADIKLDTFDLGKMLESADLGRISMTASAKGQGLTLDSLHTTLEAVITEVEAMKYKYRDIKIGGKMDQMQFNGTIKVDDPNLKFAFDGLVDLDSLKPSFSFTADLDTINLHKLNLAAAPLGISLSMDVDLVGLSSKDIDGQALIKDIMVSDSMVVYKMDSFLVQAFDSDTGKTIQITSPILNGYIAGRYNLEALPRELNAFINSYIKNVSDSLNKPYEIEEPQQFDMLLTVSNPQPLLDVMVPKLKIDTASVTGRFDNEKNDLIISAVIPDIRYDSITIEKLTLRSGGRGKRFGVMVMVDTLTYGTDIDIPHTRLYTFISNDSLRYGLSMYDVDTSFYRLRLGGYMQQNGDEYWFAFDRPMILNGDTWDNLQGNRLIVAPEALTFDRFGFQNGNRYFQLNTPDSTKGTNPLQLEFKNFPLAELSELIDYAGLEVSGFINGEATVFDIKGSFDLESNIQISDIRVNKNAVGTLTLQGLRKGPEVDVNVRMAGMNEFILTGKINTETQQMNAKFDMQRFDLHVIDPFLKDIIQNSTGSLKASATINGSYTKPDINGYLAFNNTSTEVLFAGTRFTLPNGNRIDFTSQKIDFNTFKIEDANKQTATLSGNITHDYFTDFRLNLKLNANRFTFLDTEPSLEELFYGKLVLGINASVTGPLTQPKVNINTSTKDGTRLTVAPLSLEEGIQDAPYVIYYNPNSGDTLESMKRYNVSSLPLDLTLNLEVTDEATFYVLVDPSTGDQLEVVAKGDLAVNVPANGNISIIGGLEIVSGSYRLTQSFLKRKFDIQEGSRIDISGDPMDARLSITAVYKTEISTYSLIGEQATTLTPQEQSAARKPSPVHVLLIMQGSLSDPQLSFDIQLPDDAGLNSIADRRLQQIKQDQNELNKQVFGILLMNSFITDDGMGGGGGVPGTNAALKSVSGLINQQLNRFASRIKGFSVNVDASSYQGYSGTDANNTVTAVGVSVSQMLFDDRLEIRAGGDVNLESNTGNPNQGSGLTQWAGDFVIEYKLTESGRYRVKVFNTTDYSILYQNNINRTGVGLTYQYSFRKRKKKLPDPTPAPLETPTPETPKDSIPTEGPKNEEQE